MRETVSTDDAPAPAGAYSQGVRTEDLIFTAGQIPQTPDGEILDGEAIEVQTRQCLENIAAVVNEAGVGLEEIVKITVFLDDIDEWDGMNDAYEEFFDVEPPSRSAIAVAGISAGVKIEIEAVAVRQ